MGQMSGRRRATATSLLAVLFTTISLGLCMPLLAADRPPCCPDVAEEASFTVCCNTGDEPSSEVPSGVQGLVPPSATAAFQVTILTTLSHSLLASIDYIPHRSADLQTLLSTFLI
jgi:hypothetical protein